MGYNGWIGVDLDGTLAIYDGWVSANHIGEPVPKMLARVLDWISKGIEVRILTARADQDNEDFDDFARAWIEWSQKHIGKVLAVTNRKDYQMIQLWDDRAVQVIPNTGDRADGKE